MTWACPNDGFNLKIVDLGHGFVVMKCGYCGCEQTIDIGKQMRHISHQDRRFLRAKIIELSEIKKRTEGIL